MTGMAPGWCRPVLEMVRQYVRLEEAPWLGPGAWVLDCTSLPTGSFKVAPALAAVYESMQRGCGRVVAASAGNFGAGVAYAGQLSGAEVTVVVPAGTDPVRIQNCRQYGASVRVCGQDVGEALIEAERLAGEAGRPVALLHPFDDQTVIAANSLIGRVAFELWLAAGLAPPARLYVPCGGGGLAAGVFQSIRRHWRRCQLWAAEPDDAPSLTQAAATGTLATVCGFEPWSAAAVPRLGRLPFRRLFSLHGGRRLLDGCTTVGRESAEAAAWLAVRYGQPAERASGLALAAAQTAASDGVRGPVLVVVSGRNDDIGRAA